MSETSRTVPPAGTILGIDHPALAADDPAALADWCRRVLGAETAGAAPNGARLLRLPDGAFLEVMAKDGTPRPARTTFTPGWSHLALRVKDLDAAIAAIDARGVRWTGAIGEAFGGGRLRNFADPEGNLWQIVERPRGVA